MEEQAEETSQVDKEYFTVSDIAEMAGVSRQRIHQIIDLNKLKPDIITRYEFIFKAKTLEKFMKNFKRRAW